MLPGDGARQSVMPGRSPYLWLVCIAGLLAAALGGWYVLAHRPTQGDAQRFPLSAVSASRFQNTTAQATYVGTEACATCHTQEHESYLQTTHSQALARLDGGAEGDEAEFLQQASQRWYRVYHQGGQMRHRESVRSADGQQITLADYPIQYVIGSGNFSRTYLFEADGFLIESPITWYSTPKRWEMSPGYEDTADHSGFSRPVRFVCIFCHAGRVERVDQSIHRLKIHEMSIGCERCHGPGSLHVAKWESGAEVSDEADVTIVDPRRLSRARQDDVCGQCHLSSAAQVNVRGRQLEQFRPGLSLSDFSIAYLLDSGERSMTVVGHVEQMRQSACYQQSDSLTCITCHDLHQQIAPEQRTAYFRDKCLSCHDVQACGLDGQERRRAEVQDNCVRCHMPSADTDIPHFAFTHHRIGLHSADDLRGGDPYQQVLGSLVPLGDVSQLSDVDRARCLGLAYLHLADDVSDQNLAAVYRHRAFKILEDVWQRGLDDPELHVALARAYWDRDPQKSSEHATTALRSESLSPVTRRDALSTLASSQFNLGQTDRAVETLGQLVRAERRFEHWLMLALCHRRRGDVPAALEAAHQAATIRPDRADLQALLAELYRRSGQAQQAVQHEERARLLEQIRPD